MRVASTHLAPGRIEELRTIAKRLDPKTPRVMGERSRRRLEQFDAEEAKQRLLRFPEQHVRRALAETNPGRRARTIEQALAASLAIFTCLRIENLRSCVSIGTCAKRARCGARREQGEERGSP
jgi:hypothetical protein